MTLYLPPSVVDKLNFRSRVDLDLSESLNVQRPSFVTCSVVAYEGHVIMYLYLRPHHLKRGSMLKMVNAAVVDSV